MPSCAAAVVCRSCLRTRLCLGSLSSGLEELDRPSNKMGYGLLWSAPATMFQPACVLVHTIPVLLYLRLGLALPILSGKRAVRVPSQAHDAGFRAPRTTKLVLVLLSTMNWFSSLAESQTCRELLRVPSFPEGWIRLSARLLVLGDKGLTGPDLVCHPAEKWRSGARTHPRRPPASNRRVCEAISTLHQQSTLTSHHLSSPSHSFFHPRVSPSATALAEYVAYHRHLQEFASRQGCPLINRAAVKLLDIARPRSFTWLLWSREAKLAREHSAPEL